MNHVIAATDIVSIFTLSVIGIAMIVHNKGKLLSNTIFIICVFSAIMMTTADAVTYLLDGNAEFYNMLLFSNYCDIIFGDIVIASFIYYVWATVNENSPTKRLVADISAVVCTLDIVFQSLGAVTHKTFVIADGNYALGEWGRLCNIIPPIMIIYCMIFIIYKRKILGSKNILTIGMYSFMPLVFIIIKITGPTVSFSCSAIAISLLIIYAGIEAVSIERGRIREQVMMELVNKDTLTGMGNRHCYDETINNLSGKKNIGVLFCDINGLKYVNDTLGHAQGDVLIKKFSQLAAEVFDVSEIFRISGDEFVILAEGIITENFKAVAEQFKEKIFQNGHIAAVGYSYGSGADVWEIIKSAEKEMYVQKDIYYDNCKLTRRYQ